MYTDKSASGKDLRPESKRPSAKVINKPAHAEVAPEVGQNDAEANMCIGSRDV